MEVIFYVTLIGGKSNQLQVQQGLQAINNALVQMYGVMLGDWHPILLFSSIPLPLVHILSNRLNAENYSHFLKKIFRKF